MRADVDPCAIERGMLGREPCPSKGKREPESETTNDRDARGSSDAGTAGGTLSY